MIVALFIIISLLLELYLFLKNSKIFIQYTFLLAISITFISYKFHFIYANIGIVFFYATILIMLLISTKIHKLVLIIIGSILSFILYVIIINSFRDFQYLTNLDFVKHYFWGMILFIIIISKNNLINYSTFNRFIIWVIIFLSLIGLLQYISMDVSNYFKVDLTGADTINRFSKYKLVTGIFLGPANFGNLLSMLCLYLFSIYISGYYQNINKNLLLFGLAVGVITIIATGIRTSIFSFILGISVSSLILNKKVFIWILSILLSFYLLFWTQILIIGENYSTKNDVETPVARIASTFYIANQVDLINASALIVSYGALPEFLKNPLLGTGDKLDWINKYSSTDAFLLYHAVQYGVLGLLILLFPYLFFLYNYKKYKFSRIILVLFVILLVQTITDMGVFSKYSDIPFWIIFGVNVMHIRSLYSESIPQYNFTVALKKVE